MATLTPETCPDLVSELLTVVPFGAWLAAARDGFVELVPESVTQCLAALDDAACGDAVTNALFDSTCFWLNPPAGGDLQRLVFARDAGPDAPCRPLNDGFGGIFFGTCDPDRAFCCYGEPGDCDFPDSADAPGTCQPAGAEGDPCSQLPVLVCQTGLECRDDGFCHAPDHTPLAAGDACIDEAFNLLGDCVDSFCDVFGAATCTPRRPDGEACLGPDECLSGACLEGACAAPDFCVGP